MAGRLHDKVAIVTGGSRGIGKGIAAAFVREGAQVMITGRKVESLEEAAAEIGEGCAIKAGHAGRPDDAEATIDAALEQFGRVDVLVNNAATNPYAGPLIDIDLPRWEKTFATNLTGPLIWTQLAWNKWMKDNGGAVINISSVGAFTTSEVLGVYDITKSGLVHMTQQLAAELAPSVRVNAIAPGLIKTDFARMLWDEGRGDAVAQGYPAKRLGEPEDIAEAAVFLASEDSTWILGQTIVVDGGGQVGFQSFTV